jgi:putative ABC transport system substrate-binding protein
MMNKVKRARIPVYPWRERPFVAIFCCVGSVVLLASMCFSPSTFAAEKTVGVIMTGNISYYKDIHKAFIEGLNQEGLFAQGKVDVVVQTPAPETMAWTNAARKLVAIGSSVIVSYGAPATLSVMSETSDIPIVFAGVYDPQALGISGKNVTGISAKVPVTSLIKNLKSISNFKTLGVIINDSEKDSVLQANEVKQLEGSFGFSSRSFNVKRAEDASKIAGVDALYLTTGCTGMHCVTNIVGVARKGKMASGATIGGGEASGVILTIAANPQEQGKEAAERVAKLIKGASAASLPVDQPKKVDMIINLKEATEMGLKVPFDLVTSATKVIK